MKYYTVVNKENWEQFIKNLENSSSVKWDNGIDLNQCNPFDDCGIVYNTGIILDEQNEGLIYGSNVNIGANKFLLNDNFIDKCSELFPKDTFKPIYCIVEKSLWKEFAEVLYDNTNIKWADDYYEFLAANNYVRKSDNPYNEDQPALPFVCFKDDSGDLRLGVASTFMVDNLVSKIEFINTIFKEDF